MRVSGLVLAGLLLLGGGCAGDESAWSEQDEEHALELFDTVTRDATWQSWATVPEGLAFPADVYESGDHSGAWVLSYADPVAAASLADWGGEMADRGILVKAQYPSADAASPQGFTLMEKQMGFDPEHGDWFWAAFSAEGEVRAAGAASQCWSCHSASERDYIRTSF